MSRELISDVLSSYLKKKDDDIDLDYLGKLWGAASGDTFTSKTNQRRIKYGKVGAALGMAAGTAPALALYLARKKLSPLVGVAGLLGLGVGRIGGEQIGKWGAVKTENEKDLKEYLRLKALEDEADERYIKIGTQRGEF